MISVYTCWSYCFRSWFLPFPPCRCNLPPTNMNVSNTVRWYIVGLGGETGLHTPLFENGILLTKGAALVSTNIAPTITACLAMRAQSVGSWTFWDDLLEHYEGGMIGRYVVSDPNAALRNNSRANWEREKSAIACNCGCLDEPIAWIGESSTAIREVFDIVVYNLKDKTLVGGLKEISNM